MFKNISRKKYKKFFFSFAIKFDNNVDHMTTIGVVNKIISLYSRYSVIGYKAPNDDGFLCWNMKGKKIEEHFTPKKLFDHLRCSVNGIEHIVMVEHHPEISGYHHYRSDDIPRDLSVKMIDRCSSVLY